jgi:hypothetical protein
MARDLVPKQHSKLVSSAELLLAVVLENQVRFDMTEKTQTGLWLKEQVLKAFEDYKEAHEPWSNESTRTKVMSARLAETRERFVMLYRRLLRILKSSPMVNDADLVDMGLKLRHTGGGTPAPVAEDTPPCKVKTPIPFRVEFHFGQKPHGQHGVDIAWKVVKDPETLLAKDLTNVSFETRSTFILDLDDSVRGWLFYYALRWANTRGKKGPWTPVSSIVVP